MTMGDWICENTTIRGKKFSFDRYPFQKAIADDMHPNMDVIKCSQVGLSEVEIRKACAFLARMQGTSAIFSLPNEIMYKKMSSTRIKPLVDTEKAFNPETGETKLPIRSMGLLQIGKSYLHVVNAVEGMATSTPADAVFNDEVDLSDQQMLALFASRMQNSDHKIGQRFSTPTFTGFGIEMGYSASDQQEFMCKCHACNHWNIPEFSRKHVLIPRLPDSIEDLSEIDDEMVDRIDLEGAQVVCEQCHAPLDLANPEIREWVPKHPDRKHARGYRVRPFCTDRISVPYIVQQLLAYKRRDYIRGWHNTVLGESYTDGNVRLTEADIKACMVGAGIPEIGSSSNVWVGLDMGQVCHMTLGVGDTEDSVQPFMFKAVPVDKLFEEIETVLTRYNVVGGACDRHPYTPTADELYRMSQGRILPVEYRGQKDLNPVKDIDGETIKHWQANRTQFLDRVAKRVRRRTFQMSGYGNQSGALITHLRDMVRDEKPEEPANWVKLNGNDHYFHSLGFLLSAVRIRMVLDGMGDHEERVSIGVMGVDEKRPGALVGNAPDHGFIYGDRSSRLARRRR